MFFDPDPIKAKNSAKAAYEVMIWLGKYGGSTDPIGFDKPPALQTTLDGVLL
jgi:hypothetical protein